jgi:hypothetical protein
MVAARSLQVNHAIDQLPSGTLGDVAKLRHGAEARRRNAKGKPGGLPFDERMTCRWLAAAANQSKETD